MIIIIIFGISRFVSPFFFHFSNRRKGVLILYLAPTIVNNRKRIFIIQIYQNEEYSIYSIYHSFRGNNSYSPQPSTILPAACLVIHLLLFVCSSPSLAHQPIHDILIQFVLLNQISNETQQFKFYSSSPSLFTATAEEPNEDTSTNPPVSHYPLQSPGMLCFRFSPLPFPLESK